MNDRKGWVFLKHNLKKTEKSKEMIRILETEWHEFSKWQWIGKSKNKHKYYLWERSRRTVFYKKWYDKI